MLRHAHSKQARCERLHRQDGSTAWRGGDKERTATCARGVRRKQPERLTLPRTSACRAPWCVVSSALTATVLPTWAARSSGGRPTCAQDGRQGPKGRGSWRVCVCVHVHVPEALLGVWRSCFQRFCARVTLDLCPPPSLPHASLPRLSVLGRLPPMRLAHQSWRRGRPRGLCFRTLPAWPAALCDDMMCAFPFRDHLNYRCRCRAALPPGRSRMHA